MAAQSIITARFKDEEQKELIKSLLKALKVDFEEEQPYNPEKVAEILQSSEECRQGKGTVITMEELAKL